MILKPEEPLPVFVLSMQKIVVLPQDANQRLDKYLKKYFKEASAGFLYKMLRRKNIVLNGKKAEGQILLCANDEITVYFSDETFLKMRGGDVQKDTGREVSDPDQLDVIYEDKDICIVNKPSGILTQKSKPGDLCLNDMLLTHCKAKGEVTEESLSLYKPSAMNRLDRNTSGIVLCAKTFAGAQYLSKVLKEKETVKDYHCICRGVIRDEMILEGYLKKDPKTNTVVIEEEPFPDAKYIKTGITPISFGNDRTYLSVRLYPGRPHQIRVQLSHAGHPILGDYKYGTKESIQKTEEEGIRSLCLTATELGFRHPATGKNMHLTCPEEQ